MTKKIVPLIIVFVLVAAGIAAAVLSAPGQSNTGARPGVGFATVLHAGGYRLELRVAPNRATLPGTVSVKLLKGDRPVNDARVKLTFSMLDMPMGRLSGLLLQTAPGTYAHAGPMLGMGGRWGLRFDVTPTAAKPFSVDVVDRIAG